jgi:hypothetical protein
VSQSSEDPGVMTMPGSVLVAGCGFIVTAAGWALFGFLEGELTASSTSALYFVVALAHGVSGAMILARLRIAVVVGGIVSLAGLAVALLGPQFVLVFTNCVILALLVLARRHVTGTSAAH